jgi:WD40 repeat protein
MGIVGQHTFPVEQLDVSGDGELLASCSHDQLIKFWNIKYLEDLHVSARDKADKKTLTHNLPSSKATNTADFFADMADNT